MSRNNYRGKRYDVRDIYRLWRKTFKKKGIPDESTFSKIIKFASEQILEKVLNFEKVYIPGPLGMIMIFERETQKTGKNKFGYVNWKATKELWDAAPENKGMLIFYDIAKYHYAKFVPVKRSVKKLRMYTMVIKSAFHKRVFHEITLNETNRLWQNNISR